MDFSKRAYEEVIEYLEQQILNQELKLGDSIPPERELAEKLNVSRNSVREALRSMNNMGVVSSQQGAGNFVSCDFQKSITKVLSMMFMMRQVDYQQVSQFRSALETQAYILAVEKANEKQIREIEIYVNELDQSQDDVQNAVLDKKIHYSLAVASGNILFIDILESLSLVVDEFIKDLRSMILQSDERKNHLQNAHKEIVRCLRARDVAGGCKAMEEHFRIVNQAIEQNAQNSNDIIVKNDENAKNG